MSCGRRALRAFQCEPTASSSGSLYFSRSHRHIYRGERVPSTYSIQYNSPMVATQTMDRGVHPLCDRRDRWRRRRCCLRD